MIWCNLIVSLCARLFLVLIFFNLLCCTTLIRKALTTLKEKRHSQMLLIAMFCAMALVDIGLGIQMPTHVVNNQLVMTVAAGLIGGPLVGLGTGFFSSAIAYTFMPNPLATYHYPLMIAFGLGSGYLSAWLQKQKFIFPNALLVGFIFTTVYLFIDIFFSTINLPQGYVIEDAFFPLLFSYSLGISSFLNTLEDFFNQQDKIEGISAKTALKITNSSISILQNGLNATSASETVNIILQEAETFDFVAITSLDQILGFASYRTEKSFLSFLENDFFRLFKHSFKLDPSEMDVIRSYIQISIYNDKHHVGYFCCGHILNPDITPFENTLVKGIGTMITNQITVHGIKEKAGLYDKAEIKALQSQINPHFLFNALSTISYYCSSQPQTAKSLINDLASYYRNNLTDANTMISIRNELQHINAYIHLEQARFGDRLKVDYDINVVEPFQVPALILQPIVENAIRHGLYQKLSGGQITIKIDKRKSSYYISVRDNGLGISPERLQYIFDTSIPKKSIGLTNVNQRLIALYGPKNRLRIYSRVNKGTIVIMKIPIQEVNETND